MRLTYFGHSCFLLETAKARLVLDPFLTGNPACRTKVEDVACDYVIVSHAHEDHSGDALALSKRCDAPILAVYELAEYFAAQGAKTHALGLGGGFNFPFGRVKLTLAHHTSSVEAGLKPIYLGAPAGLLLTVDGKNIYHAGDTALFMDMQLIGRAGLDLALLPIGDNFTMGPDDALDALGYLKPRLAVPMHYNTWPIIAQDAAAFARRADLKGHVVRPLQPGEMLDF